MMVAVSIFAIVMVVSTGALLSIVDSNRKAQSQQVTFSNIDFAIESMSRAIRVGTTYHCDYTQGILTDSRECSSGAASFAFEPFGGSSLNPNDQVVYRLNNNQIERSTQAGANGTFVAVTAPEVIVEGLSFYVRGSVSGDTQQPLVLVSVHGYTGSTAKTRVDFNVQTSLTQRLLDI